MKKVSSIVVPFVSVCLFIFGFWSCKPGFDWNNSIDGNGKIVTQTRNINKDFTGIDASAGVLVILEQSQNQSVTVEAESNLQDLIQTKVANQILVIELVGNISATKKITIRIKMPKINSIAASCSAKVESTNTIQSEELNLQASSAAEIEVSAQSDTIVCKSSSAGHIELKGMALKIKAVASSGGNIEGFAIPANEVVAEASSGAVVHVHPIVVLTAEASSGGSILYQSVPKTLDKKTSSGGSIEQK